MAVVEITDASGEVRLRGSITGVASFNGGTITTPLNIDLSPDAAATGFTLDVGGDFEWADDPFVVNAGATPLFRFSRAGQFDAGANDIVTTASVQASGPGAMVRVNTVGLAAIHILGPDYLGFFGTSSAQRTHIADPAGGATIDAASRTAIAAILDALEAYGLLAAS